MMLRYFTDDEFKCKCSTNNGESCGMDISLELKALIDNARDIAGVPFVINSGARCETYNAKVGGRPNSAHLEGMAVDIKCTDSRSRSIIERAFCELGVTRKGVYKSFLHFDVSKARPQNVTWLG